MTRNIISQHEQFYYDNGTKTVHLIADYIFTNERYERYLFFYLNLEGHKPNYMIIRDSSNKQKQN